MIDFKAHGDLKGVGTPSFNKRSGVLMSCELLLDQYELEPFLRPYDWDWKTLLSKVYFSQ
jgi:hypothetical protein